MGVEEKIPGAQCPNHQKKSPTCFFI